MFVEHNKGMEFMNRTLEVQLLKKKTLSGVFGYVTGRRRVGKTALLVEFCKNNQGFYHQSVQGTSLQQITYLTQELKQAVPLLGEVAPKNWSEFFSLLTQVEVPHVFVLDEFPYLVSADATLPSVLQKWIDHVLPQKKMTFLVSGSSQSMLYSQFLEHSAPLYGRAKLHLHLKPLSFAWFCKFMRGKTADPDLFALYSLVGGIPHYWQLMTGQDPVSQADCLFFSPSALLADEPKNIFNDENVTGNIPKAIIDLAGQGVHKPSEIAARLGVPQMQLSRPFTQLIDLGLIAKELPFGESARSTKRVLYQVEDASLRFYYSVFLPHRSRWFVYDKAAKKRLIHEHASTQWENYCRSVFPSAQRYWEAGCEIDLVAPLSETEHLVAECKWTKLSVSEEKRLLEDLRRRFATTQLSQTLKKVTFKIFSQAQLVEMAEREEDRMSEKEER